MSQPELITAHEMERARFSATRFRPGYEMGEVDDILDRVVETLYYYEDGGEPLSRRRRVTAAEVSAVRERAHDEDLSARSARGERAVRGERRPVDRDSLFDREIDDEFAASTTDVESSGRVGSGREDTRFEDTTFEDATFEERVEPPVAAKAAPRPRPSGAQRKQPRSRR